MKTTNLMARSRGSLRNFAVMLASVALALGTLFIVPVIANAAPTAAVWHCEGRVLTVDGDATSGDAAVNAIDQLADDNGKAACENASANSSPDEANLGTSVTVTNAGVWIYSVTVAGTNAPSPNGGSADEEINLEVLPVLTLQVSDDNATIASPVIGVANSVGVSPATYLKVATNAAKGFDLTLVGATPTGAAIATGGATPTAVTDLAHLTLPTYGASTATLIATGAFNPTDDTTASTSRWGYQLQDATSLSAGTSYDATDDVSVVPATATSILTGGEKSNGGASAPTDGFFKAIYFAAQINASLPSGSYRGFVKYTATATIA